MMALIFNGLLDHRWHHLCEAGRASYINVNGALIHQWALKN